MNLPTAKCTERAAVPSVSDHTCKLWTIFTPRILCKCSNISLKSMPLGVPKKDNM